jgi:nucleoside-diphosphate-sugar epimerase
MYLFNYVDNIIDGLIAAGTIEPPFEGIINIGSNQEIAIRDLVRKIHEFTSSESELRIGALAYRPTEIWRMCAANSQAEELLGWKSKISFDEGLKRTVEWFKHYLAVFYDPSSQINQL